MQIKECKKCKTVTDRFYKHKFNGDGLYGKCIDCTLSEQREYYLQHKCTPKARAIQKIRNEKYRRKINSGTMAQE
jgi:hypothetical protein